MARQTKQEKAIDKQVETAFYQHGTNVPINVMDIGKIYVAGHAAAKAGVSIEEAVKIAIAKYRQQEV